MKSRVTLLAVTAILVGAATPGRAAGKSDMADAVMKGDKAALRTLLRQKADVNAPQVDGATALHWAVYRDDLEAADLLIAAGAKVDAANREAFTPLAMASLYGNAPMIERLLTAGADAKQRLANGETMVMLAARNGNPLAIRMLVAAGADVNAKENLRCGPQKLDPSEKSHENLPLRVTRKSRSRHPTVELRGRARQDLSPTAEVPWYNDREERNGQLSYGSAA
jgi:ankyrin repeat protein